MSEEIYMSETGCNNVAEAINYLKNSLLYQMSLGSKELYHSNVWAWLIKQDKIFMKVFFPNFDDGEYEVQNVYREWHHKDITIELHRRGSENTKVPFYYIIENKIKSLPSDKQLEEYSDDKTFNKKNLLGAVLTSTVKLINRPQQWKALDCLDVAAQLRATAQNSNVPSIYNHIEQILEYCSILEYVCILINKSASLNKNILKYDFSEICKDNDLRLNDIFIKAKGNDFLRYINNRIEELEAICPKEKGFDIKPAQSYHNGNATLDIFFSNYVKERDGQYFIIGIQIEGTHYRLVVERAPSKKEETYNEFKNCWFDGTFNHTDNRTVFGKKTSMKLSQGYCSYGNNFVYQYWDIDEDNNSYDFLFTQIKSDLQKAKNIILEKY